MCVARTETIGAPMCTSRVDFGLWFLLFALLDKIDSSITFLSQSYFYIIIHQNIGSDLFFLMVALRSICFLISLGPALIILSLPLNFFFIIIIILLMAHLTVGSPLFPKQMSFISL